MPILVVLYIIWECFLRTKPLSDAEWKRRGGR